MCNLFFFSILSEKQVKCFNLFFSFNLGSWYLTLFDIHSYLFYFLRFFTKKIYLVILIVWWSMYNDDMN